MEILHLSDTHITDGNSLEQLWIPASEVLKGRKFDFIVLSGDLTQSATEKEYIEVENFIKKILLQEYLHTADIARIVLVPGNHDVCWPTCVGLFDHVQYDKADQKEWDRVRRRALEFPSEYRIELETESSYKILKVKDSKEYAKRFHEFQKFYNKLYGLSGPLPNASNGTYLKPFNLLKNSDEGDDYSVHIATSADGERVCFVGLNSCHANDKYSKGACFNHKAISAAYEKVEEIFGANNSKKGNSIRIGVWHHGLSSEKGGYDFIGLRDFSQIRRLDLQLVLHGHTHKADRHVVEQLKCSTVCKGAGTLTAGKKERGDSVGRQFSIYSIENSYINTTVYEYRDFEFKEHANPRLRLVSGESVYVHELGNQTYRPPVSFLEDKRKCEVDDEGVSTVTVELKGIEFSQPVGISLAPIYLADDCVRYQKCATVDGIEPVRVEEDCDGSVQHAVTRNLDKRKYESLHWQYQAFNQIRLSKSENAWFDAEDEFNSERSHEKISHVVCWETFKLTIDLHLPSCTAFGEVLAEIPCEPYAIEEKPIIKYGVLDWVVLKHSPVKMECGFVGKTKLHLQLVVHKPIVGHRYTLKYELPDAEYSRDDSKLLDAFTAHCRASSYLRMSDSVRDIRSALVENILHFLNVHFSKIKVPKRKRIPPDYHASTDYNCVEMMVFFWCSNETSKNLRVCFGNTSPSRWLACYSYGEPLLGHAFRFNKVLAFYNSKKEYSGGRRKKFDWIVYVPIRVVGSGTDYPIGVVSIAHIEGAHRNSFVNEMSQFAKRAHDLHHRASGSGKHREYIDSISTKLSTIVGVMFWEVLANKKANRGKGYLNDKNLVEFAKEQVNAILVDEVAELDAGVREPHV